MLRNSYTKWLWDNRRSIVGWTLGIVGVGGFYASFWPTIDNPAMRDALENYPEALLEALNYTDIATAAGYVSATVYGLLVATLIAVYAIGAGTRAIAGDEDDETLDLVLAHPIGRTTLALQRFAAVVTGFVVVSLVLWVVMLGLTVPAQLEGIPLSGYASMHLQLVLYASVYAALTFAIGAGTGRKGLAIAAGAVFAVFGYAANGILPQIEGLAWTKQVSSYNWLTGGAPLTNGLQWDHVLIMTGLVAVFVAAGIWGLQRRDLAV